MLEYAVYSVISPEGCASILFKDAGRAAYAAEQLKITSADILELGIADAILGEPLGGAHNNWEAVGETIRERLLSDLSMYQKKTVDEIFEERYHKFRSFGRFEEEK